MHAIALNKVGFNVSGSDIDQQMIKQAKQNAKSEKGLSKVSKKSVIKKDVNKQIKGKEEKKIMSKKAEVQKDGKLAVIETRGKQYMVYVGSTLKVEKLKGEKGDIINFDKVLLVSEKDNVKIGNTLP